MPGLMTTHSSSCLPMVRRSRFFMQAWTWKDLTILAEGELNIYQPPGSNWPSSSITTANQTTVVLLLLLERTDGFDRYGQQSLIPYSQLSSPSGEVEKDVLSPIIPVRSGREAHGDWCKELRNVRQTDNLYNLFPQRRDVLAFWEAFLLHYQQGGNRDSTPSYNSCPNAGQQLL